MIQKIDKLRYLQIGVQGENNANDIQIDVSEWVEAYPGASIHLLFKPYNAIAPSPMAITVEDGILTWRPSLGATVVTGVGYTEIRAVDPETGMIKKSRIVPSSVENSVSGVDSENPPEIFADWVNNVLAAGAAAAAASHGKMVKFEINAETGHLMLLSTNDETISENTEWTSADLGPVDAYAMAVLKGYSGTADQFSQYMADIVNGARSAAASAAEAAQHTSTAVHEWLDDKFGQISADPPLDRTLSEPLAAAPADIVGDINGTLNASLFSDIVPLTWTQGAISTSNGHVTDSATRCRAGWVLAKSNHYRFVAPEGYKYIIFLYSNDDQNYYDQRYIESWLTGTTDIWNVSGKFIRIVCAYSNDADITPSDISAVSGISLSVYYKTEKVVTNDLFEHCPNLFSEYSADYAPGKGYSKRTETIVNDSLYCISGYIPVKCGDYIKILANKLNIFNQHVDSYPRKVAFYNSSKEWVKTLLYSLEDDDSEILPFLPIELDGYIRCMFRINDLREIYVSSIRNEKLVDLIVFAGQSNMAGRGITSEAFPQTAPDVIPGAGYEFKSITDPTKLYLITEPFGYAENSTDDTSGIDDGTRKTGDMVPSFVNAYYANNGNIPVVGVSASEGGSSSIEWQPETGNNFTDLAARVESARTWLADNGYSIRHQYCVWCQGESDGDNINSGTETLEDYEARARAIFDGLIALGLEKVLLVRIGHHNSGSSTRYKAIIDWQTEEAKTNENLVLVSCDFASMRSKGMMKDSFHYYQIGYNITGNSAGLNSAFFATTGKEPTMYDPENNDLYYSHKT